MRNSTRFIILVLTMTTRVDFALAKSIQFNHETMGVAFSAYIMPGKPWSSYTFQEVYTMLDVISTKFTKITTFGVGAEDVPYRENYTYYHSLGQVYSAEAAAILNKKSHRNLTLTVGIWLSDSPQQTQTEIELALESVLKANQISPGTVKAFVIGQSDFSNNPSRSIQALEEMKSLRRKINERQNLKMKIGTRQNCNGMFTSPQRIAVLKESDFIICAQHPTGAEIGTSTPEAAFKNVKGHVLRFKEDLAKHELNSLEVELQTGWPTSGAGYKNATVENMIIYSRLLNAFGRENKIQTWLHEAFDSPWKLDEIHFKEYEGHYGFWKFDQVGGLLKRESYIEKSKIEEDSSDFEKYELIFAIFTVILILASALAILEGCYRLKKKSDPGILFKEDIKMFRCGISSFKAPPNKNEGESNARKSAYDTKLEIKKGLKISEVELGSGEFGYVWKGTLLRKGEQIQVAVKQPKAKERSEFLAILTEIKILSYLGNHENIVGIVGAVTANLEKNEVSLAIELCWKSLKQHLITDRSSTPEVTEFITTSNGYSAIGVISREMHRWAYEIACGMQHLEKMKVIHGDLATRNVLLTEDKKVKITDFGLARHLDRRLYYRKRGDPRLPWEWSAVESLDDKTFTSKSDVWSYGVSLWEIFSEGQHPFKECNLNEEFVDELKRGKRLHQTRNASNEMYEIMKQCWNIDPRRRPSFTKLKCLVGKQVGLKPF